MCVRHFLIDIHTWVVVGYIAMFWYINYSTQRSRAFYARQQASLGELDAYMEDRSTISWWSVIW